jgi:hypothetical protein
MARPLARNSALVSTIKCGDMLPSSFSSTFVASSEDARIREDGKNAGPGSGGLGGDLMEGAAEARGVEAAEVNPRLGRKQREEREKGWVAARRIRRAASEPVLSASVIRWPTRRSVSNR